MGGEHGWDSPWVGMASRMGVKSSGTESLQGLGHDWVAVSRGPVRNLEAVGRSALMADDNRWLVKSQ